MQYQTDYVLRLIEQMGGLVRAAFERVRGGAGDAESYEMAQQAIGLALDVDPELVVRLSPSSLAGLVEMSNLDDRVVELIAEALTVEVEALEGQGEIIRAGIRREQAVAVLGLLDTGHAN
jgi:hypothetical protein